MNRDQTYNQPHRNSPRNYTNPGRNYPPQKFKKKDKPIYCHNCGKVGHQSKTCRLPIMSYGIILFYPQNMQKFITSSEFKSSIVDHDNLVNPKQISTKPSDLIDLNKYTSPQPKIKPPPGLEKINPINPTPLFLQKSLSENDNLLDEPIMPKELADAFEDILQGSSETNLKYLMILDRHTPDYVQIIWGNYSFDDPKYIRTLISRLTQTEIKLIETYNLTYLFVKYWIFSKKDALKIYKKQYQNSKEMFVKLKAGVTNKHGEFIKFSEMVEEINPCWEEPDWGFPKGRRRRYCFESDIECAIREFKEETGIDQAHYEILTKVKPIEEIYQGSNGVTYKHIYYLAKAKTYLPVYLNPYNSLQVSEIKNIGWYTYEQGIKMIRQYHSEKKSVLNKIHHFLKKNFI